MSTEVIVPFRGGQADRDRAWAWCLERWLASGWKVTVAIAPAGEWCKAAAVTPAVQQSDAETIVVSDADVWCEGIHEAVHQVEMGALWAVPHWMVHRLDEEATAAVLTGGPLGGSCAENPYPGHLGGGIVVLPQATYLDVPLDPRFRGWSREDDSWSLALHRLVGNPWRGVADLWHLFHEPQARTDRVKGSPATERLYRRYKQARHPELMRRLIDEAKEAQHAGLQRAALDGQPVPG